MLDYNRQKRSMMISEKEKLEVIQKAKNNDPRSLYRLGIWYCVGINAQKDRLRAKNYYAQLLSLGADAVNGLDAIQDYPDMLLLLAYMHFNDNEPNLAKAYFLKAGKYLRQNFVNCIADKRIEEEKIIRRVTQINEYLNLKEEVTF